MIFTYMLGSTFRSSLIRALDVCILRVSTIIVESVAKHNHFSVHVNIQISLCIRAVWSDFVIIMKKCCILGYPKCLQRMHGLIWMFEGLSSDVVARLIYLSLVISTSRISNNRLSRSENLVHVQGNELLWKRGKFSPFIHNIVNIFLTSGVKLIFIWEMWLFDLFLFPLILQNWHAEVRISRSIS